VDVTVLAGVSAMSTLRASDVVPYIDLNGMGEGTYTLNILFELPDGFASENFAPSVTTITVTISRG
jgi:YbbR domain-containing protein